MVPFTNQAVNFTKRTREREKIKPKTSERETKRERLRERLVSMGERESLRERA